MSQNNGKKQLKEYKISNFSWEQSLALQEGHVALQHTMLATQTQCLYKLSTQFRSYIYYISYNQPWNNSKHRGVSKSQLQVNFTR